MYNILFFETSPISVLCQEIKTHFQISFDMLILFEVKKYIYV